MSRDDDAGPPTVCDVTAGRWLLTIVCLDSHRELLYKGAGLFVPFFTVVVCSERGGSFIKRHQ